MSSNLDSTPDDVEMFKMVGNQSEDPDSLAAKQLSEILIVNAPVIKPQKNQGSSISTPHENYVLLMGKNIIRVTCSSGSSFKSM